jgi:hypothetical protein
MKDFVFDLEFLALQSKQSKVVGVGVLTLFFDRLFQGGVFET